MANDTPDKNQLKITSMFGPTQMSEKITHRLAESEVNSGSSNVLSEPTQKQLRISEQVRESETTNYIQLINPDLEERKNQLVITKGLE